MSIALFALFVALALAGVAIQVRARGDVRQFAIGGAVFVASLPVFAAAWLAR